MIKFIENIGDFYSQHFFADDFHRKVFDKMGYVTQKKDGNGNKTENHISEKNARISPLRQKYDRFKNDLLSLKREKDKVKRTSDFHGEVLEALDYRNGTPTYNQPVFLNEKGFIPVRLNYTKGGKPYLFVMEMKAIVHEGDKEAEGIYDQIWAKDDWQDVFPKVWGDVQLHPDVVRDALSELFLLPEDERPTYVILLAGAKIFMIHYEKWKYDSFLLFDLEELFIESRLPGNHDYLALFYALLAKPNFLGSSDSLLQSLDEDAHKAAYGVTQNLKNAVIYAVENLANEAIWYKKEQAKTLAEKDAIDKLMAEDKFAKELKDECLTLVYRLLFLFYAEAREDLEILPVKDQVYQKGYSLEMLRDLEMIALTTDSSRNGYFFSKSLWKLFDYLHNGVKTDNGFAMKPLDSPLVDNAELKHLTAVQFRNIVLQEIVKHLSVTKKIKGKRPGRISYANLGINQLGSVYESLLAFNGFFASGTLIEVKKADDPDGKEGTFLVPLSRRDEFEEDEILKDTDNPQFDKHIPKGHFVYRLNGRDRKKSASFYTPEVLTQTTVKYTLKGIIDNLKARQEAGEDCAGEILKLKILEPAMGAAAFQNEVINQLAVIYLELKEKEEVRKGRKRIVPGNYTDELQKVKAYIAANNVYGVDLNPTAVELGKLSLWLNCMHRNMETPFFAHRLGVGNAVVGCWLKVYDQKDVNVEYPKNASPGAKPLAKAWWTKAPTRVIWNKQGKLSRKPNQFYHFLLPDENMLASANIKLIKEEFTDAKKRGITEWKKEFKKPITTAECKRLEKLCKVIDTLLDEHHKQIQGVIKDTTSTYLVYGQESAQTSLKGYNEKERLAESRNARTAPFYKLRMIMDYWCSLWFWDARQAIDLPTRDQWYNEVENILGIDLSGIDENADARAILENIRKHASDQSTLFGTENRLKTVEALRKQHRFFHHELEFLEVFKERGGFDVVVGNPPWLKLAFEEKEIIAEQYPEILIRITSASQVRKLQEAYLSIDTQKKGYFVENIGLESSGMFMNAVQNFPLLRGQQTNLYKCVLENCFTITGTNGFMGLLHPEGVYDDPNGQPLRKEIYNRLKYHFQFRNEYALFTETNDHGRMIFSVNIYSGSRNPINFISINNLFQPSTIDACFSHTGIGNCGGIKIKDGKSGKYGWNLKPHKERLVHFSQSSLTTMAKLFENSNNGEIAKLVSIHSQSIINVLEKLSDFRTSARNFEINFTEGFHETNAQNDSIIERKTKYPDYDNYEIFYSGPSFLVSNPISKNPKSDLKLSSDYDVVNLNLTDELFLNRTNFVPIESIDIYKKRFTGFKNSKNGIDVSSSYFDHYKLIWSRMIGPAGERTLQTSIGLPKSIHVNTVNSMIFKETKNLIEFTGLTASLVLDYFVKTIGKADLRGNDLLSFPLGIEAKYKPQLFSRTLQLNCLNKYYTPLWEESWQDAFAHDQWSKPDNRLKSFDTLTPNWQWSSPLRNWYERRMALVEIDVITAMALGLTLDELILIYNVQFPVLQQNEDDTWYDQRGNIIFTCSKGLNGVGIDRPEWEKISQEVNPMQRKLTVGETYIHTITKSELYQGQQITYYAPFDKCDRVEDYKVAWAWFEKVFGEDK